jgi:hypothetical protein
MKNCPLCGQKMDLFTTSHKNSPFVDNKNYATLCFTCYFVPKVLEQVYAPDGSVSEEKMLDYSCENMCSATELHERGTADTIRQARRCVEAVKESCKGSKNHQKHRPKATWNIC